MGKRGWSFVFILKTPLTPIELTYIWIFPCHLTSHQEGTSSWRLVSLPVFWCPFHLVSSGTSIISTSPSLLYFRPLLLLAIFHKNLNMLNSQSLYLPFINNPFCLPWTSFVKKSSVSSSPILLFLNLQQSTFSSKPGTGKSTCQKSLICLINCKSEWQTST